MHWLAQGLRKVQVEPGVIMATQDFKRNLFLNLYREGGKNLTLVVCFLLLLKREIKIVWHLQPISSIWRPLAFLPVTCHSFFLLLVSAYSGWGPSSHLRRLHVGRVLCLHSGGRWAFIPSDGQGSVRSCVWGVCGNSGLMSLSCLVFGWAVLCCVLRSSWVAPGLGYRWRPSWEFSPINTPWGQEFSDGLGSWIQCSHPEAQAAFW